MVHTWLLKVLQAQTEDSERRGDSVAINIYGEQDIKIFESGVKYFK